MYNEVQKSNSFHVGGGARGGWREGSAIICMCVHVCIMMRCMAVIIISGYFHLTHAERGI